MGVRQRLPVCWAPGIIFAELLEPVDGIFVLLDRILMVLEQTIDVAQLGMCQRGFVTQCFVVIFLFA